MRPFHGGAETKRPSLGIGPQAEPTNREAYRYRPSKKATFNIAIIQYHPLFLCHAAPVSSPSPSPCFQLPPSATQLGRPLATRSMADKTDNKFPEVQGGGSLIVAWQIRGKNVLVVGGGEVSS